MQWNDYECSVNLFGVDLSDPNFLLSVTLGLKKYDIRPDRMIFEIVEEIATLNDQQIMDNIRGLHAMGCKIAIDDFGTKYSNIERFCELDSHYLKIDWSCIRAIREGNNKMLKLIRIIVSIAHDSEPSLEVVIEWIETKEEQLIVEALNVDYSQGYLFSRPVPESELEAVIASLQ